MVKKPLIQANEYGKEAKSWTTKTSIGYRSYFNDHGAKHKVICNLLDYKWANFVKHHQYKFSTIRLNG
jgi:hypothetical protein